MILIQTLEFAIVQTYRMIFNLCWSVGVDYPSEYFPKIIRFAWKWLLKEKIGTCGQTISPPHHLLRDHISGSLRLGQLLLLL
jgi:hypothetical protein